MQNVVIIAPQQLYSRYNANEVATDQALSGKTIQITAPVKSIDKDFTDSAVLKFSVDDNEFDSMQAELEDSEKNRAANLTKGQVVTIQCQSVGRVIDSPVARHCVFVDKPASNSPVDAPPTASADQSNAESTQNNAVSDSSQAVQSPDSSLPNMVNQPASAAPANTPVQRLMANTDGPSFDCASASDATAKAICASPELSLLDRQMAILYYTRTDYATDELTRDQQRQWIHDRDASCLDNADCLRSRYNQRIAQLKQQRPLTDSNTVAVAGANDSEVQQYALAIQTAIQRQWLHSGSMPAGNCVVHIEQLPGGKLVSAKVDPECPYSDQDKGSVENAVWAAQPLPYKGFENVFQRDIDVTFAP